MTSEGRTAKLYIFDVDGTLRWTTIPGQPCPNRPGEWELMPNVKETLRRIDWGPSGAYLGVASNQGGVAVGYLTRAMAYQLIEETIRAAIGFIPDHTAIEMCVCPPRARCACRKPEPGMLLRIMERFGVPADQAVRRKISAMYDWFSSPEYKAVRQKRLREKGLG